MSNFEKYNHHGKEVWVRTSLKGKHRDICLCHSCKFLDVTSKEKNCPIANKLFQLCKEEGLVTPVFECPKFEEKRAVNPPIKSPTEEVEQNQKEGEVFGNITLVVGNFYKTDNDETMVVSHVEDDIYMCVWHEQALDDPNHGMIPYSKGGRLLRADLLDESKIEEAVSGHIVRAVTDAELKEIMEEIPSE
jgi:hypothetical protein